MKIILFIILNLLFISNVFAGSIKINEIHNEYIIDNLINQANTLKNENNFEKIDQIIVYLTDRRNQIINSRINKVLLGYTSKNTPIYAYYKGDLNKGFTGIFANIHGGYEYGTYLTAEKLLSNLQNSDATQWFIIPTINPDGLKIATNDNYKYNYYLEGRDNSNGYDINRSFCTNDFVKSDYVKKGIRFHSSDYCNKENENLIIDYVLNEYKFNNIISLHSEGGVFYIPDGSYYDQRIIDLGEKLKTILPNYYYNTPSFNEYSDKKEIKITEINEGNIKNLEYTGLMENYIYQRYNVPTILIEFEKHGEIEYDFLKITNYLK